MNKSDDTSAKDTSSANNNANEKSQRHDNAKPKKIVLVAKRKRHGGKKVLVNRRGGAGKIRKRPVKQATASTEGKRTTGLPTFQHRHNTSVAGADAADTQTNSSTKDDDDHNSDSSSDSFPEDIASETLVAIHSIIEGQQGLSIPLCDNLSIQAVLENQVYSTFQETNATSIHRELLELVENNQIRQLYCQDKATTAYVLTRDFVQAVWDAVNRDLPREHYGQDEIVTWYVSNLRHWTGRTVSRSEMEAQWEQYEKERKMETKSYSSDAQEIKTRPFHLALKHLMDLQLLIRDNSQQSTMNSHQDAHYYMWLPQWAIVLKAWSNARTQLIGLLARSKEISKMNLLRQNRHSHVSTQFLLNELVYKGVDNKLA
ncbi:MAG: hypothetical protein SGARI_001569 [Bacillariaceae sp.]